MNDVRTSLARRILDLARIEAGASTLEEKARVRTFDRLNAMLSALDSKTSVLLRFNAIDDGGLDRLGAVVARRTSLYSWAWRFAVAGGLGFAAIIVVDNFN
jgi:hypothetical protein